MATSTQQLSFTPPHLARSNSHGGRFPSTQTTLPRTETELMRLVALGDHDAFLVLYDRHAPAALGVALRMTRSAQAAEEIVQEAFVKLWRRAGTYDAARGSLRTFVLGVVRNRAIDAVRSQNVRSRGHTSDEGLEETHEASERTEVEATRREEAATLRAALGRLPQGQSRAIELAFFAGLSHRQIAAQLDTPIGTVKSRIRSGLEKLRRELRCPEWA